MKRNSTLTWIMVPVFMVAGLIYVRLIPDSYDVHKEEVVELFHLPPDAEFVAFRSPYRRGILGDIEAVVQFPEESWQPYIATLDDPSAWPKVPFRFRDIEVTAPRDAESLRWWEGEQAWIMDREYASFWIGWGFIQRKEHGDLPSVNASPAWKSQCWVVIEQGGVQRTEPCRNYKHGPPGRKFYVRSKLEKENRRLFVYIR
ncbi:MAG: hypothetical protein AB8H79_26085 [Myxococcota bacterium]